MNRIELAAKVAIQKRIKTPVESISTKHETMYVSTAIQACVDAIIIAQQWISVEEELPELDLPVFVKCEYSNGRQDYDAVKRIASKDNALKWQWSSISHNTFFALKITHWRPIEFKVISTTGRPEIAPG